MSRLLAAVALATIVASTGACVVDDLPRDQVQFENRSDQTVHVYVGDSLADVDVPRAIVTPGRISHLASPPDCMPSGAHFFVMTEAGQLLAERSMATDPLCRGDVWIWPEPEPSTSPSP